MASITKRNGRWCAQVRKTGFPSKSASFLTKVEARRWAIDAEADLKRWLVPPHQDTSRSLKLCDLIHRYCAEVTAKKQGREFEAYRLQKIARSDFAGTTLANLTAPRIAKYRDDRLGEVAPATVHKELSLLQSILKVAVNEWGVALAVNPFERVSRPRFNNARERRLSDDELEAVRCSLSASRNPLLAYIVEFAIETGMRRSEILSLEWSETEIVKRTVRLPRTKNGQSRIVPLSPKAFQILALLVQHREPAEPRVFPITINAFKQAWTRAVVRSGVADLHFHDLRHEAISRFFEQGLSMPEVALISGHRDPRMLFRYTHLSAVDIAKKLAVMME